MADRIYKGKLAVETDVAFPEASENFDTPHLGGLVPFEMLKEILEQGRHVEDSDIPFYKEINGSIWLSGDNGVWVKVDPDGSIEVGSAGA
jgi:hypothetical protein